MLYAQYYSRVDTTGATSAGIEAFATQPDATYLPFDVPNITWLYLDANNNVVASLVDPALPPVPTTAQIIAQLETAVQTYVDSIAKKRGYDSGVSCASYASSTITTFAADALAFIKWRDDVWITCQQIENTDLAATPPIIPTASAVIAALPVAPW